MSDEHVEKGSKTDMNDEALAILEERKWSTSKFLIGVAKIISNLSTVSWAVYTYFVQVILRKVFTATNGDLDAYLKSPVMIILVSGWVVVTFVMACDLQKAFSTMIANAKIVAELKAELKGIVDGSKIIESVRR
jgi:ABC-type siderophore export system fused ATPase/permease subunit